jgi:pilus assembly protein CpaE
MANSDKTNKATATTALLICPDVQMLGELNPLLTHNLAGVQIEAVKDYPSPATLSEKILDTHPRLCFLDVASDTDRALTMIQEMQTFDSGLQVVVVLKGNTPDLILRCLRQGAAEFLMHPFTADDLKPVLVRLSQLSPTIKYGQGGKIICVIPTKGACGASTIAANLAYRRRRLGNEKILLADLDPLTGTISFLLKLKSNYSFLDAMNLATSLDGDLWKGVVSSTAGIDVVLAPENPMDTLNQVHDPSAVLEFARQLYDTIIVDSAGAFGDWGVALASIADELLLVTTNELPALQATQKVLAHLDRNRIERAKVRLVVNRYSREVGLSKEAIATALHTDVYQVIPSDYEAVQRALVEGKPINSASAFGKSMITLAERLAGHKRENGSTDNSKKPKKAKSVSLSGMFSSIFSKATS